MLRRLLLTALLTPALLAAGGCGNDSRGGGGAGSGSGGAKVSLVAYSTPQEAYKALIPAFRKTQAGKGATFSQSYGPSGDQARAVIAGLPTDFVHLSLEPDVDKLVEEGLVAKDWKKGPEKGFVSRSVVSLVVRKGNPKGIEDWDDLLKPGVEVITPNVFTSGGAKWNVMAAYGAAADGGKDRQAGVRYLQKLYGHVPVQPKSAREALQTFVGGKGDVLLSYENEALIAQKKGEKIDYVTPDETLLIENPGAVVTKGKNPEGARAFLDFLKSDEAQRIFQEQGYRPVKDQLTDTRKFPKPKGLFTIDELGGWKKVNDEFFDPEKSVVADINKKLGVETDG